MKALRSYLAVAGFRVSGIASFWSLVVEWKNDFSGGLLEIAFWVLVEEPIMRKIYYALCNPSC